MNKIVSKWALASILVLAPFSSAHAGGLELNPVKVLKKTVKNIDRTRKQTQTNLKHLRGYGKAAINRTQHSINKALNDPIDYILSRPERLFSEMCAQPIRFYEQGLRLGSNGKWKKLPPQLIRVLQSHYPNVNLNNVAYAENIATSNGQAQAIGRQIYFPRRINLANRSDMFWMLHEIEHTQQFSRARLGASGKLCEYVFKAVGNGFSHDHIDMERAADRKASYLIDLAMQTVSSAYFAPPQFTSPVNRRPIPTFAPPQRTFARHQAFGQRCATPIGVFGPGRPIPLGAPCQVMTPRGPVFGRTIL